MYLNRLTSKTIQIAHYGAAHPEGSCDDYSDESLMNISIKVIPHDQQRYPTVGDYWLNPDGSLEIRVSESGNWKYDALVAVHELIEVLQTESAGIKEPESMAFDQLFERECEAGQHGDEEPGDDPRAPYREQHIFAECVERLLAQRLGVNWSEYDVALMKLWRPKTESL